MPRLTLTFAALASLALASCIDFSRSREARPSPSLPDTERQAAMCREGDRQHIDRDPADQRGGHDDVCKVCIGGKWVPGSCKR